MTNKTTLTRRELIGAAATAVAAVAVAPLFDGTASASPAGEIRAQASRGMFDDILNVVSERTGVSREEIMSEDRRRRVVSARQRGMWIYHALSGKTAHDIGLRFGGRSHMTVLHALRKIDMSIAAEPLSFISLHLMTLHCVAEIERNHHTPADSEWFRSWSRLMGDRATANLLESRRHADAAAIRFV